LGLVTGDWPAAEVVNNAIDASADKTESLIFVRCANMLNLRPEPIPK
jgi:hypothetical protein